MRWVATLYGGSISPIASNKYLITQNFTLYSTFDRVYIRAFIMAHILLGMNINLDGFPSKANLHVTLQPEVCLTHIPHENYN